MAKIDQLLNALKSEVDRINEKQTAEDNSDALSEVFLDAIHKTLKDIKMGADSDDFSELTIINFVIMADSLKYSVSEISSFVRLLKNEEVED